MRSARSRAGVVIPRAPGDELSSSAAAFESPPSAILAIRAARAASAQLVWRQWRWAVVNRFWLEKALLALDAGQLYALLWQLSQPWPWPGRWLRLTRWVNALNGDVLSFRATGAAMGATGQAFSLWGEWRGYWAYALAWGLLPPLLVALAAIFDRRRRHRGAQDAAVAALAAENALLQFLPILYVPVGLAVLRLVNCDADGRVSVDPGGFGRCGDAGHVAAVGGITVGLGGGFLLGLPWWLHRRVARRMPRFPTPAAHERFLQTKELEFLLGASDTYLDLFAPQVASYRLDAVNAPVALCGVKLALLVVFALLRSPAPGKRNEGTQGTIYFVGLLALAWRCAWRPPFRLPSTNRMARILSCQLAFNGVYVVLCANGVRSAMTVSTAITAALSFVNVTGLACLALALLHDLWLWTKRNDLVMINFALSAPQACWPMHPLHEAIVQHASAVTDWTSVIRDANEITIRSLVATPSMQPYGELTAVLGRVDAALQYASSIKHPLAELLYEVSVQVNNVLVDALASSPFTGQAPDRIMFQKLSQTLKTRESKHLLMVPQRHRVLHKVLASRMWASSTTNNQPNSVNKFVDGMLTASSTYESLLSELVDWQTVESVFDLHIGDDTYYLCVHKWSASSKLSVVALHGAEQEPNSAEGTLVISLQDFVVLDVALHLRDCGNVQPTIDLIKSYRQLGGKCSIYAGKTTISLDQSIDATDIDSSFKKILDDLELSTNVEVL